jgi:hypothetical protein
MRLTMTVMLAGLLLLPTLEAQEKPASKPAPDRPASHAAREYETLLREWQSQQQNYAALQKDLVRAQGAARTEEERQKTAEDLRRAEERYLSQRRQHAGRFLELAQKYPKDSVAVDALVLVTQFGPSGPEAPKALDILFHDHIQSEKLGPALGRWLSEGREKEFRAILEKNPHRAVQGRACYELAIHLDGKYLRDEAERDKPGAEKKRQEAEKLYECIVARYADLKDEFWHRTLGELARAELFERRHLVVGKVAPAIEGEDQDGKKFKLSDYRGKVVLLDFWGAG